MKDNPTSNDSKAIHALTVAAIGSATSKRIVAHGLRGTDHPSILKTPMFKDVLIKQHAILLLAAHVALLKGLLILQSPCSILHLDLPIR